MNDHEKALAVRSKLSGEFYVGQRVTGRNTRGQWVYEGVVADVLLDGTVRVVCDTGSRSMWFVPNDVRPA